MVTRAASRSPRRSGVSVVTDGGARPAARRGAGAAGAARPRAARRRAPAPDARASGILHDQFDRDRLAEPDEPVAAASQAQRAYGAGEQQVDGDERGQQQQHAEHGETGARGEQHDDGARRGEQPGPPGQRHSARDRDRGEHAVQHAVGGHALQLGLGAQLRPGAAGRAGPAPSRRRA